MRIFRVKGKKGDTWYIDYNFNGKRIKEAVGPHKKMAEAALAKRGTEVVENKFRLDIRREPKVLFDEICQEYFEY